MNIDKFIQMINRHDYITSISQIIKENYERDCVCCSFIMNDTQEVAKYI